MLLVGDINGDGIEDLVTATAVLLGNGDGTFQAPLNYTVPGNQAYWAVLGDFNGDGKTDVATLNSGGVVSVFLGNGDGTFQIPLTSRRMAPALSRPQTSTRTV